MAGSLGRKSRARASSSDRPTTRDRVPTPKADRAAGVICNTLPAGPAMPSATRCVRFTAARHRSRSSSTVAAARTAAAAARRGKLHPRWDCPFTWSPARVRSSNAHDFALEHHLVGHGVRSPTVTAAVGPSRSDSESTSRPSSGPSSNGQARGPHLPGCQTPLVRGDLRYLVR